MGHIWPNNGSTGSHGCKKLWQTFIEFRTERTYDGLLLPIYIILMIPIQIRHGFTIFKTGIATGNSRDIFNTTCDAMSSWSLDPMLRGAVWLKINLEKQVCTLVSWPMFQVTVALPSGYSEKFSIGQSSKVGDLRVLAQKSFQRGFLRLVAADHRTLDPAVSLQAAGLEDGDHLTAIVLEAKLAATAAAFALFCSGGDRVVTWGHPKSGADSSEVQDQLKGVQQVEATSDAFATILADGSVVTWGSPDHGGDSSEVQDQLKGVQQVQATSEAFAAILADGSVATWGPSVVEWGDPENGGDSFQVQDQLKSVQKLQATWFAFAAILADGSGVTWGEPKSGGDSSEVQDQLKGVQQVQATSDAFAAILADGSVVTWGWPRFGGDSSEVQYQLKGVQQVQATGCAFAAILADGSVVTWGEPDSGGDSSPVAAKITYM